MTPKKVRKKNTTAAKKRAVESPVMAGGIDESEEVVLTKEGLRQVQEELDHLRNVVRPESLERMREARQYGEPMENAELEDAKSEQAAVDARILELKRLVKNARVVESAEHDGRVHVGTSVKIKDTSSGEEIDYHIVGAVEADPTSYRISNQSPVGQALLGKKAGDMVEVATPAGSNKYKIVSVE